MTAVLRMNIDELDAEFIENIKAEHASSDIEIHMSATEVNFSESDFWEIIAQLDWSKLGDDTAVTKPAILFLSNQTLSTIYAFVDMLAQKLYQLDTRANAQVFLKDENEEDTLSVDDFLYARCAVVGSGQKAFEAVMADPAKMPTGLTFEPLLHLATAAYKMKTGKKAILKPSISYETYSNREGWNG